MKTGSQLPSLVILTCALWLSYCQLTAPCPQGCACRKLDYEYVVHCANQQLSTIPSTFPVNTSQMLLEGNSIQTLQEGLLSRYPKLRDMSLIDSGIEEIQTGAFSGLQEMTSLDLTNNRIRALSSHVFQGLQKLEKVILDNNSLVRIESYAFGDLGSLYALSIKNNPDLSEIQEHAFKGANIQEFIISNVSLSTYSLNSLKDLEKSVQHLFLTKNRVPLTIPSDLFSNFNLQMLSLEQNGITDIKFLENLSAAYISLAGNNLSSFDVSGYPKVSSVISLNLDNVGIDTFNPDNFSSLTQLSELYLSNNKISSLPLASRTFFSRLGKVYLEGNPLHCNCRIAWLKEWIDSQSRIPVQDAECFTPFKTLLKNADISMFSCSAPSTVSIREHIQGGIAMLVCKADGDPPPSLAWTTPSGDEINVLPNKNQFMGKSVANLTLQDSDKNGMYICQATNMKGAAVNSIKVDVYKTRTLARSHQLNVGNRIKLDTVTFMGLLLQFLFWYATS